MIERLLMELASIVRQASDVRQGRTSRPTASGRKLPDVRLWSSYPGSTGSASRPARPRPNPSHPLVGAPPSGVRARLMPGDRAGLG